MKFWLLTRPRIQVRKVAMLEDYFEEEEEQQQQPVSAEVAITNNGQQNQPTALPCVFSRPEKGHSVPDVIWACAWCLVLRTITQK